MKYDWFVKTKKIIPPLAENSYAAKAEIHEIGKGPVDHGLGEVWGKTRGDAEQKMSEKIKKWLIENP